MSTHSDRLLRFGYTMLGFCAALGLLSLLQGVPVHAQAPGVNLTALYNQVQTLSATVTSQGTQITSLQTNVTSLQSTVTAQATKITTLQNNVTSLQNSITGLKTDVTRLQTQTQYLSTGIDENGYPATFLTGCNVWVQDGSGSTNNGGATLTGLGNLIIGYNTAGNTLYGDVRNGSHNLVLGDRNNYSSYGGLVAGTQNAISDPYASISGGLYNTASGLYSSVIGGIFNTASGYASSVSGGYQNTASGSYTSVSGGLDVTDSIYYSWSGGSYHSP